MKHDPDFMERINRDLAVEKAARRILDVPDDANHEQLKKAYRSAAIRYHPDHNENTEEANRRFALIQCAYEFLAFGKPCDLLLAEIESWREAPEDDKYRLDNSWGHFCWWREKYFDV